MRELKFRAWSKKLRLMSKILSFMELTGLGDRCNWFSQPVGWDFDKLIWMQYTGLKDKNGVEIYEGDIYISYGISSKYVVGFALGAFVAGPIEHPARVPLGWESDSSDQEYINTHVEVIGNIHENPELLK